MKSRNTFLNNAGVILIAALCVLTALLACTPPTKATEAPLPVILSEGFSLGVPPPGWGTNALAHWLSSATTYAGGVAPEAEFTWAPGEVGDFRMYTCPIDTTGFTTAQLEFREFVNDYNGIYTLEVQTSIDGGMTWITAYTRAGGPFGPATTDVILSTANGLGSATFQIAWTFSGDSFNINYWYIDDVTLSTFARPDLVIWPTTTSSIGDNQYDPPTVQTGPWSFRFPGGASSFFYRFDIEIQNDGSAPLDSTIQVSYLPYTGFVLGALHYVGPGGPVNQFLPIASGTLAQIPAGSSQMMTLRLIKFPASSLINVRITVVSSSPPILQDIVTVHT